MTRRDKIVYWISTCWLALGMVSTALVQLLGNPEEVAKFTALGYPAYLLPLLGIWKLLGAAAVLAPRLPLIKEWAYAGFFFAMSGAAYSHIAAGGTFKDTAPSLLLIALTAISWYFRPGERKLVARSLTHE